MNELIQAREKTFKEAANAAEHYGKLLKDVDPHELGEMQRALLLSVRANFAQAQQRLNALLTLSRTTK